jgi:hypothetical protein
MRIAQRGTSYTYSTATAGAPSYYCVDRWSLDIFGGANFTAGSGTLTQVQDAPTGSGLKYSLKFTVSSPTTTPNGMYSPLNYRFEGYSTMDFGWGAPSTAVPAVCSFWFKASIAGTYAFSLTTNAGDAGFVTTFPVYNVGTWEYKVIQIVPATFGTFTTDSTASFSIRIAPQQDSGTSYRSASLGTWVSSPSYVSTCAGVVNISATSGAYIQLTGVQLEKGTVATPFEVRPYATELALCQRYYQTSGGQQIGGGIAYLNYAISSPTKFIVQMRTTPQFTLLNNILRNSASGNNSTLTTPTLIMNQNGYSVLYDGSGAGGVSPTLTVGIAYDYQYTVSAEL